MTAHMGNVRPIASARLNGARKPRATRQKKAKPTREYLYGEGPAKALSIYLSRTAERLTTHAARAAGYGFPQEFMIVELIESAVTALGEATGSLARVPKNWKPLRGSMGGMPISDGTLVTIKADKRDKCVEISNTDATLRVIRIIGGKAVCEVVSGGPDRNVRFSILRSHLQKAE